jgi:DNA repair exonuclease SbcCD ATPase subunit
LDKLTDQYTELNAKIKEIMSINSQVQDLKLQEHSVKVRINSLIDYRENIENEMKNLKSQTSKDEIKKIKEYENELTKLSDEFNDLSEQKIINSFVSSFLKDSGIKAKIIKQYIPVINKLINKYLSSMEFMCQFELNEEFNETIKSRYRDEFSYSSFSEGEKMRINLAILFSWRAIAKLRNSINTNLLIMDEVFDSSLDSNGTEEFMKI